MSRPSNAAEELHIGIGTLALSPSPGPGCIVERLRRSVWGGARIGAMRRASKRRWGGAEATCAAANPLSGRAAQGMGG